MALIRERIELAGGSARAKGAIEMVAVEDPASLIVIEAGARWPSWVADRQRAAPNSFVEVQTGSEPPQHFAQRVSSRVVGLSADRKALRLAVIATNGGTDPEASAARSMIARALLRAMARSGGGELVLSAESTDDARHELFALAGALCEGLKGSQISVSVRFSDRRSSSGTMPKIVPMPAPPNEHEAVDLTPSGTMPKNMPVAVQANEDEAVDA